MFGAQAIGDAGAVLFGIIGLFIGRQGGPHIGENEILVGAEAERIHAGKVVLGVDMAALRRLAVWPRSAAWR